MTIRYLQCSTGFLLALLGSSARAAEAPINLDVPADQLVTAVAAVVYLVDVGGCGFQIQELVGSEERWKDALKRVVREGLERRVDARLEELASASFGCSRLTDAYGVPAGSYGQATKKH